MRSIMLLAATAATLSAAPSMAAVLTFEGVSNTIYTAPIDRSGYTLGNVAGDEQHFHEIDSAGFPGFVVSNGTGVLYNDRNTRIEVSKTGGGLFTLGAFDGSAVLGVSDGAGATILRLTAFVAGLQTATADFTINGLAFASFSGAGLGVFDRLEFDGIDGGGGFQLDNVTLEPGIPAVPEPATWGLMLAGFGALGAALRRGKASAVSFA